MAAISTKYAIAKGLHTWYDWLRTAGKQPQYVVFPAKA
jgi:hypothetical protein